MLSSSLIIESNLRKFLLKSRQRPFSKSLILLKKWVRQGREWEGEKQFVTRNQAYGCLVNRKKCGLCYMKRLGGGWSWMLFIMKMWTFTIVQLLKIHRMKAWYQAYGTWGKSWLPFFSSPTMFKNTFLFFSSWWYNLLFWTDCGGLPCHSPKPIGQPLVWSETSTMTPHQSALLTSWFISSTYKNSNEKLMSTTQLSYY